ncbi:MAG: hypothetical protein JWO73_931 [Candidatus Taylorbacteria bacterium]|nr:hypothetical protein [Candidatus Taylorbacteria bacterium]
MINYDDFAKVEIKAGKILSAEKIPETDKLLKLSVDFGETAMVDDPAFAAAPGALGADDQPAPVMPPAQISVPKHRQIVSGISMHFPDPAVLVGRTAMFVTNLEPRKIKGFESNGMLFAISTPDKLDETGAVISKGSFSLLEPSPAANIPPGTRAC